MKMNNRRVRDSIIDLLERELPQGKCTLKELGDKIEVILNFFPHRREQKDKDAPKKTRTAYTFFCRKNRPEKLDRMREESEDGTVKSVDVVRALAEDWKELKLRCINGDEEALAEMNVYKAQSTEDMGRYLEEDAAYKKRMHPQPE